MSLMGTLAKVAVGVIVAKGIGGMMKPGGTSGSGRTGGSTGGGGMFGNARSRSSGGGDLGDVMGDILSGGRGSSPASRAPTGSSGGGGGLGDLLEELTGRKSGGTVARGPSGGGGLDDILGRATRSGSGSGGLGGGLGDILGSVLGGAVGGMLGGAMGKGAAPDASGSAQSGQITPNRDANFGEVLNQAFHKKGEPDATPTPEQNAAAGLMLRAMIQAAKSDGEIDEAEKQKLMGNLGDASPSEIEFVKAELAKPLDVDGLVRQVPEGLGPQIYTMSVMAIDLDNQNEAQYLHKLATGLGIGREDVNGIHAKLGVPALYG
jgi:uncharacterized membrane protein YebE (DUF533 family)